MHCDTFVGVRRRVKWGLGEKGGAIPFLYHTIIIPLIFRAA